MSHLNAEDFALLLGMGKLLKGEEPTPEAHIAALLHLLSCPRCRRNVSSTLFDLQLPEPVEAGDDPRDPLDASTTPGSRRAAAVATEPEFSPDANEDLPVRSREGTQEATPTKTEGLQEILYAAIDRISAEEQGQRSPEAHLLAQALLDLPIELRLDAIESQTRFRNPQLAYTLVDLAKESHDPLTSGHLARVAGSLLRFQAASSKRKRAEAVVSCLMADAERSLGRTDLAEDIFRDAALALRDQPLILEERAFLCRTWAALRHEQERTDEAIALLEHAATVAEELGQFHELALSRLACGWLLLDEDETERAIFSFREAYALLAPDKTRGLGQVEAYDLAVPQPEDEQQTHQEEDLQAAFAALHGLALAFAELGDNAGLHATFGDLNRLLQSLPDPLDTIRVHWIRAKAQARLNNRAFAISEMDTVFESLLRLGPGYEVAQAAMELALLVFEGLDDDQPVPDPIKQLSKKVLSLPHDRLLPHLRPAIEFALKFPLRRKGDYLGVLLTAPRYLEKARFNAAYPFHPLPEADCILLWGDLTLTQRRNAASAAGISRAELDQDGNPKSVEKLLWIAWTHEALTGTRLQLPMKVTAEEEDTWR